MKIIDYIMKGLGFETSTNEDDNENKTKLPKPKKEKKIKSKPIRHVGAKFNFQTDKKEFDTENTQIETQNSEFAKQNPNITTLTPKTKDDLKKVVDFNRKRLPAIVDLSNFSGEDLRRAVSYLEGAMYAMRGKVQHLQEQFYIVAPEGSATIVHE